MKIDIAGKRFDLFTVVKGKVYYWKNGENSEWGISEELEIHDFGPTEGKKIVRTVPENIRNALGTEQFSIQSDGTYISTKPDNKGLLIRWGDDGKLMLTKALSEEESSRLHNLLDTFTTM